MRGSWRPNRTEIFWPLLLWPSTLCLSRSPDALPEALGSTLMGAGFFFTASYQQLLWSPNSIGVPEGPLSRVWLSLPQLVYNSVSNCNCKCHLTSVLTRLYNSSTPTRLPTRSLEWHDWSSFSGNNWHAVHRSLSSGASVYECIMGLHLVPFHQLNPPTWSLSITGHWNVSLSSGASLCNGMFARAEGQNTTKAAC